MRGNLSDGVAISSGVSDKFDNLQEQKPDQCCDEWENGLLTESIIASIEEQNALDRKIGSKKFDKTVPFSCFSTELGKIQ